MTMRRRRFLTGAAGAAAAAAAGVTAGCGNLHSSDPDVLTFMFRGSTEERDVFSRAVAVFEERTGYEVQIISTSADQYATKLQTAILGNSVPDVFYLEPPRTMAYVTNGVLADLTPYVEATDLPVDDIWTAGLDLYRFDGEQIGKGPLYAMPKDLGPFSFGYNKTLFEEMGVELPDPDVPLDWDEFLYRCQALTGDRDGDGATDSWGTSVNIGAEIHSYVWSNGGELAQRRRPNHHHRHSRVRRGPAVHRGSARGPRRHPFDQRDRRDGRISALAPRTDRLLPVAPRGT